MIRARPNGQHLAFGHGLHFCLGAPLARMEGRIAVDGLLSAYPEMRLRGGELEWRPGMLLRGLSHLPIHLN